MSEALQAPLLVMLLSNLVAIAEPADDRQPVGELVTIALVALAIGLLRVTAPLLMVPMLFLLASSAVRPWRRYTSALAVASAAILAGGVAELRLRPHRHPALLRDQPDRRHGPRRPPSAGSTATAFCWRSARSWWG